MNKYKIDDYNENQLIELKKKILEINDIQSNILECVDSQGKKLDSIEENITNIDHNIELGTNNLKSANKYYFGYKPIFFGAAIGACILGPGAAILHLPSAGLLSGLGGLVGGIAGYKIQKL